jgi:hypothetical protein
VIWTTGHRPLRSSSSPTSQPGSFGAARGARTGRYFDAIGLVIVRGFAKMKQPNFNKQQAAELKVSGLLN